jgi:hypothetical protein
MAVFCVHSAKDQSLPGQVLWSVSAGNMDRPSHTKSHPAGPCLRVLGHSPLVYQAGRRFGPAL